MLDDVERTDGTVHRDRLAIRNTHHWGARSVGHLLRSPPSETDQHESPPPASRFRHLSVRRDTAMIGIYRRYPTRM